MAKSEYADFIVQFIVGDFSLDELAAHWPPDPNLAFQMVDVLTDALSETSYNQIALRAQHLGQELGLKDKFIQHSTLKPFLAFLKKRCGALEQKTSSYDPGAECAYLIFTAVHQFRSLAPMDVKETENLVKVGKKTEQYEALPGSGVKASQRQKDLVQAGASTHVSVADRLFDNLSEEDRNLVRQLLPEFSKQHIAAHVIGFGRTFWEAIIRILRSTKRPIDGDVLNDILDRLVLMATCNIELVAGDLPRHGGMLEAYCGPDGVRERTERILAANKFVGANVLEAAGHAAAEGPNEPPR